MSCNSADFFGINPQILKKENDLKLTYNVAVEAFGYLPDVAFFVKDLKGRFLAANPAFLKLCGVEKLSDLVGKTDLDFFNHKRARLYQHDDAEVINSRKPLENQIEPMPLGRSSAELIITSKFPLRAPNGEIKGVVGVSRNFSEAALRSEAIADFKRVVEYIEINSNQSINNKILASIQGMSISKFEREFKKLFHMTPSAYHQQVRIKRARHDLLTTKKSIGEIASEHGFHDQSHFTKRFTLFFGMSPLRFRKNATVPLP